MSELSKSIDRLHHDLRDLREDISDLHKKIDDLNDKKIIPLQIFKARTLALLACLSLAGGATGSKIDKIFFKDEQIKIQKTNINQE